MYICIYIACSLGLRVNLDKLLVHYSCLNKREQKRGRVIRREGESVRSNISMYVYVHIYIYI